jgi:6-phosphogluconolactonase
MPEIEVLTDLPRLAERAAGYCLRRMGETLRTSGRFSLALAGGSTPRALYAHLAEARLDWERVHFFWGDERGVPPGHPDSNYRMAQETLLARLPLPPENVHRIPGERPAREAARQYEAELRRFFGARLPRFDLVLLGLGGDGHTGSLFPLSPAVRARRRWAVPVRHTAPPPPLVDRVTLTLPVLNAAAQVVFLVAGADKAGILTEVLEGPFEPERLPAQGVRPAQGGLLWLVDAAAAARLSPHG